MLLAISFVYVVRPFCLYVFMCAVCRYVVMCVCRCCVVSLCVYVVRGVSRHFVCSVCMALCVDCVMSLFMDSCMLSCVSLCIESARYVWCALLIYVVRCVVRSRVISLC